MPHLSSQASGLSESSASVSSVIQPVISSQFEQDDLMIGCECAHPALQIERWGQEVTAGKSKED